MRYSGITDVELIEGDEAFVEAAIALLGQAQRHVRIRSGLLDPPLFDTRAFNEALSAFARRSRYSEVHVLVDNPDVLLKRGHRTVRLMRRLSQKIIFKQYYDEPEEQRDSFILTDNRGLLIKSPDRQAVGYLSLSDSVYTTKLVDAFKNDWDRSPLARQLRQLAI